MVEEQFVQSRTNDVLIVDNTTENTKHLTEILIDDGYSVSQASSGEQALRTIKVQLPDLILLGIVMPESDGFEVCRQIKADPETCTIPIIFISALDDEQLKVKGFELGAVDFITKPFRKIEILSRIKNHIHLAQLERQTQHLQSVNKKLQAEVAKRKQTEAAMKDRIVALTKPFEDRKGIDFSELFDLPEIQKLQDQFADAFGVASIITKPDGTPITKPSNFCRLCNNIIRGTEIGLKNCMHSDAILGKHNPDHPVIQPCLSGGLWDAGSSITVGGLHVANWLIGQVRNESQNEQDLREYAKKIGADEQEFMKAHSEVTVMSDKQFRKVSEVLFTISGQISQMAYQNIQQARFINDRKQAETALLESEELFRTTLFSVGDGVITTDAKGKVKLMNGVAEQLTQWSQDEAIGKTLEEVFSIINEDTREQVEIPIRKVLREGVIVGLANHTLLIAKDGTERPIADSGAPIRNEKGEIVGVVLVFRDQTEERKAEKVLIESKNQLELSLKVNNASVFENNFETGTVTATPELYQFLGYEPHEIPGILYDTFKLIHPDDVPVVRNAVANHFSGKTDEYFAEFRIKTKSGKWRWIDGRGKLVKRNVKGDPVLLLGISRDIHARKLTEEALRNSEFFFRESQRAASIGSYNYNLLTGFWDSSEVLDQIFGIDKGYIRSGDSWVGLIYPDDLEMVDKHLKEEVIGKRNPFSKEYRIVRKSDGEIRWVNGLGQLKFDAEGNILSLIGTIQDITARKLIEEALKENEAKFRNIFEHSPVGKSMTGIDGSLNVNRAFCEMLGYTELELKEKKWADISHPDDLKRSNEHMQNLLEGKITDARFEKRYIHKNGNVIWTDVSTFLQRDNKGNAQYFITNANNITQRKEAEESLRRNEQKFRALIENSSDAISLVDSNGIEIYHSPSCQRIIGFSEEERNGKSMMELIHPDDLESLVNLFAWILKNPGIATLLPTRIRRNDGLWCWIEGVANNLLSDLYVGAIVINFRDITERKLSEDLLLQSEIKFRTLIESSNDGISLMDLEGNILFANSRKAEMMGAVSHSDLVGLNAYNLITPEYQKKLRDLSGEFMEIGYLRNVEVAVVRLDGSVFWAEINFSLVSGTNDAPSYIMEAMRDISDRKQAEMAILDEKNLLRILIDNLPDPIYVKDQDGRKMIANRADLENIGVSHEHEVFGKSDLEIFNSEMGYLGYEDDLIVIESGEPIINREDEFFDNNGVKKWLLTTKIPILNASGKSTGLVGIGRNITEQKKANETIQKLSKSIEQSPSTIIITDINGTIEYVNPKFSEISGYTKEEAIGQNPSILNSGENPLEIYKQLWETITAGNVWRGELHNRKKNGELYWEWVTITSLKNELGNITNYIAIKEDISLRKQMEVDLIIAKEKAEESDRLKSSFLANMSHEIRTPLNSIIGFSELLSDSDFQIEQKLEFVAHIIRNGNNLLNIINDIVDISKIEAGEITIRKSKILVKNLMNEIQSQHTLNVEEKLLQFKTTCFLNELDEDIFVVADKERLQQIFNNLISNALKFTTTGYIQVGCEPSGNMIKFHVKDTGIGIPKAFQDLIFDRFRQVETSLTRKFGGNGLGLAISKNLVELMGGTIWVESETGKGSTFYFTLPANS